jgi:hypothetical protein
MTMPAARHLVALAIALAAVVLAGCGDDTKSTPPGTTGSAAPSITATSSATPTTLSAKAELLAAYNRSWDVYADALRRLDPSRLPTAFASSALRLAQQEVAEHKANGQPSLVRVTHRARVLLVTATDGVVQDNYTNHSVLLDPATGKPTEPDPNEVIYQRQSLKRIDGVWKVVEVIEERRS